MFETCVPDQAKLDIRAGVHEAGDDYKIALYLQSDAIETNRLSVTYDPTGEISAAGYTLGGQSLGGFTRTEGKHGIVGINFKNPVWPKVTFTTDGAVIYNTSKSNKILVILAFGMCGSTNGSFSVNLSMPIPNSNLITFRPEEYSVCETSEEWLWPTSSWRQSGKSTGLRGDSV